MFISISNSENFFTGSGNISGANDMNSPVKITCKISRLHKSLYELIKLVTYPNDRYQAI